MEHIKEHRALDINLPFHRTKRKKLDIIPHCIILNSHSFHSILPFDNAISRKLRVSTANDKGKKTKSFLKPEKKIPSWPILSTAKIRTKKTHSDALQSICIAFYVEKSKRTLPIPLSRSRTCSSIKINQLV